MTTLAERREWMRDGCPVVEQVHPPPPAPPVPCREFKLAVDREGKRIMVACQGCSKIWSFGGLRRASNDRDLTFVTGPMNSARQFICRHAIEGGADREAAEKLYKDKDKMQAWHWAAAEMDGDNAVFAAGVLGLPGDGLYLHHGTPAWLEQAKTEAKS